MPDRKVTVECNHCGKQFEKSQKEANRSAKLSRPMFCSRSCLAFHTNKKPRGASVRRLNFNGADEFIGFRKFIGSAKKREMLGDIDLSYLKDLWEQQGGRCVISGIEMHLRKYKDTGRAHPFQASLDRIDNTKGYERGNVRFICAMANLARAEWDDDSLLRFCRGVVATNG